MTLSGTVTQANQIEIKIDGQFDGVVPLNAAATTFTTTVQLASGTHTIQLTAIDACQIANAVDTVVVTYQAPPTSTTGSIGRETTTTVTAGAGVVVGEAAHLPAVEPIGLSPLERFMQPLINAGRSLDLVDTPSQVSGQRTVVPQLVRFGLIAAGLAGIIFATQIARFFSTIRVGFLHGRHLRRLVPGLLGVGLVVLGFVV